MGCKLLILADDFTGALDTAASLAREGIPALTVTDLFMAPKSVELPVLVMDTESRHLEPAEAYNVYEIIARRWSSAAEHIYIRTDSALRGNLSAYLAGAIDGLMDHPEAYFLPAFPAAGRTTENGHQLLGGTSIEETSFAADSLNPVKNSRISELLNNDYEIRVKEYALDAPLTDWESPLGRKTAVFDALTQEDLRKRGEELKAKGLLRLTAGCAGFAGCFPSLLELKGEPVPLPGAEKLLVLCGSINDVTFRQLDEAEKAGWTILSPTWEMILSGEAEAPAMQVKKVLSEQGRAIFAVSRCKEDVECFSALCKEKGLTGQEIHNVIQNYLRKFSTQFYRYGETPPDAIAVFGGDTLFSTLATLGGSRLTVIGEVEPGVPVSMTELSGHQTLLITKSGDAGSADVAEKIGKLCRKAD